MGIVVQGFTGKETKRQLAQMADDAFAQMHPVGMWTTFPKRYLAAVNHARRAEKLDRLTGVELDKLMRNEIKKTLAAVDWSDDDQVDYHITCGDCGACLGVLLGEVEPHKCSPAARGGPQEPGEAR